MSRADLIHTDFPSISISESEREAFINEGNIVGTTNMKLVVYRKQTNEFFLVGMIGQEKNSKQKLSRANAYKLGITF